MTLNILIVEDDPVSARVMRKVLGDAGYRNLVVAPDAASALRATLTNQFDLLLVDWVMPGLSGLEFVKRARAGVKHAQTPIVMVTGQADLEHVNEAAQVGIHGYLVKPPSREALLKVVHKAEERIATMSTNRVRAFTLPIAE